MFIMLNISICNNKGSAALSEKQIKPKAKVLPELSKMNFVLLTKDDRYSLPINDSSKLWHHSSFNPALKTVILVTGWTSNINETNDALETIWAAYKCRGNVNFIVSHLIIYFCFIHFIDQKSHRPLIQQNLWTPYTPGLRLIPKKLENFLQ